MPRFTCTKCNYTTDKKKSFLSHMLRKNACGNFDETTIIDVVVKDYNKLVDQITDIIADECADADELKARIDKLTVLLKRMKFIEPLTDMDKLSMLDEQCYQFIEAQKIKLLK